MTAAGPYVGDINFMLHPVICALVAATITDTPMWVRRDLASSDVSTRERAEDAMAARIAAALLRHYQSSLS